MKKMTGLKIKAAAVATTVATIAAMGGTGKGW